MKLSALVGTFWLRSECAQKAQNDQLGQPERGGQLWGSCAHLQYQSMDMSTCPRAACFKGGRAQIISHTTNCEGGTHKGIPSAAG